MRLLHAVMNATVGASVATAGIGLAYRRYLDAPGRWFLAWVTVDAIASVASIVGLLVFQNTQYTALAWYPCSAWAALAFLATTQHAPRARQRVFVAAALVGLVMLVLTAAVEKPGSYARLTGVLHGLTLLVVGAAVVLQRARMSRGDMFADQRFLFGAALMVMGAPSPFLAIGVRFLHPSQSALRTAMFGLKGGLALLSYGLMVVAFHLAATRLRVHGSRPAA